MPEEDGYRGHRGLLGVAGFRGCLANQDAIDMSYMRGLPSSDREFMDRYSKFVCRTAPTAFYVTMVVWIVLGAIGNMCFFYFFANSESRVFFTKDALFFRRMSMVDFLICAVVLPYGIVFEARILTNDTVCKSLEFLRHVIVYTSHLMLTFYSMECPTKDNYFMVRHRFNRTILLVFIASLVLASPTMVIFEAGNRYSFYDLMEENASMVEPIILYPVAASTGDVQPLPSGLKSEDRMLYFNPKFCHMSLNLHIKANNYSSVKNLQTWYMMMNGFVFFVSSFTLMAQVISLMESNPLAGRSSVFVQVIEVNYPELTAKLQKLEIAQVQWKQQRREARRNLRLSRSTVSTLPNGDVTNPVDAEDKHSNTSSVERIQIFGSSVDNTIGKSETNNATSDPEHNGHVPPETSRAVPKQRINASLSDLGTAGEVEPEGTSSIVSSISQPDQPSQKVVNWSRSPATGVSLFRFIFSCQLFRSRRRRIRMLGSAQHSLRTYKFSIMALILIDLLVLCGAIICYIVTEERSFVLNLVHFKSVFSFFIISFFHDELYNATWGGASSCCRRHHRHAEPARNSI